MEHGLRVKGQLQQLGFWMGDFREAPNHPVFLRSFCLLIPLEGDSVIEAIGECMTDGRDVWRARVTGARSGLGQFVCLCVAPCAGVCVTMSIRTHKPRGPQSALCCPGPCCSRVLPWIVSHGP